jgi:hypothetical protein
MCQEAVLQLLGRHENCIEQLLHLRVLCLSILEDLANKVHRLLLDFCRGDDCTDNNVGGRHI